MIGIFDSGVGGMTVAHAIEQLCPGFPYIYFGDLAHSPYGSKSAAMLTEYSRRNTDFLLAQGAKLIVIACNSASSVASSALRRAYAELPILDVISPAVHKAAVVSRSGRIGVIGTRATVNSGVYPRRLQALQPEWSVYSQACPLLVPLVEEGWLDKRETRMVVRQYLRPLRNQQIDTLILGCTHYPLLKKLIVPRIGRRVQLIDSSIEVAQHLRHLLHEDAILRHSLYFPEKINKYYVSDLSSTVQTLASNIFGRPIVLEKKDV